MLYLGTPSSPEIRQAMSDGRLGCMLTRSQGNVLPDGSLYGCDNERFGKDGTGPNWPGEGIWFGWLTETIERYGRDRCLFAVAPDMPFDAAGTLEFSRPWLARIRQLGIPAAFAAQNGSENGLIPWGEFDVLFIAGDDAWKEGEAARLLVAIAIRRGLESHMGRVNTLGRLKKAYAFGCSTCDGTTFARGPDKNLESMLRWLASGDRNPVLPLWEAS